MNVSRASPSGKSRDRGVVDDGVDDHDADPASRVPGFSAMQ